MNHPNILVTDSDGIVSIEISRRDKKNAITGDMYRAMSDALCHAREQHHVRVVLIRGQSDLFTAGNDLGDFLHRKANDPSAAIPFLHLLSAFEKPLVAAVAGNAVGIGTTLLLHCDLVYAAENAKFQLPFVNLALCPEAGSSLLLPRLAGHQRAAELLLLGEPFDAATAREAGFVNRVVAADQLMETAMAAARKLAALPSQSLAVTKALMKRPPDRSAIETIDEEAIFFADLVAAPAAKEIFSAFLEKRPADPAKIHGA
ncbi:MAG: enoyl-CoA hydratase [Sulfuritalea sp.]|jgi:enoyl-CoA hydratase/carnithine racemase|nr:enoyl-CoA hydratase [Sulfuritalea sp.]